MNMPTNALISDKLSYGEAVAEARVRAGDERHQIAKDARNGFDALKNSFPTFWSAAGAVYSIISRMRKSQTSLRLDLLTWTHRHPRPTTISVSGWPELE